MDHRIQQLQHHPLQLPKTKTSVKSGSEGLFKQVLHNAQSSDLKVSKHAQNRLSQRNITIGQHQWEKISTKVNEAKEKGITDSLVVMNDAALIVSTKNQTVITAMDRQEATSQIFTNINGTILMDD